MKSVQNILAAAAKRLTIAGVARKLGASERAVSAWISGERKPSGAASKAILEAFGGERPKKLAPPTPPPSLARPGLSGRDRLAAVVEQIEAAIAGCDEATPKNHLASLYAQLQAAVARVAALDGEGALTVSAIVKSSAWRSIEGALLDVLRKHPGAAEELSSALGKLGAS